MEHYTILTNGGDERQVEGGRLANSSWAAPKVFEAAAASEPVDHPFAPPGPRIGLGHHNHRGKLFHHGPMQVHVPSLDLTMRGIGGNGKKAAYGGYAAWKKSLLGKKHYA